MSTPPPPDAAPESPWIDRLLALLILGPAIVLALPKPCAPLWWDPFPSLSGAGLAAIAITPLAVLLLWRPAALRRARDVRGPVLLAILLYYGLIYTTFGGTSDTFEARRALNLAGAALVLLCGAGNLGREGRRVFLAGVLLLSGVWTGFALGYWFVAGEGNLQGVLGNPGPLSQAALPGAAIAAWILMRRRGSWRIASFAVLALFLAHAVLAGMNAGLVSIGVVFLVGAWRARRNEDPPVARRMPWILLAVLVGIVAIHRTVEWTADEPDEEHLTAAEEIAPSIGGGVEVRLRIWWCLPRLILSAPVLGIGPGQFAAEFPPHRDRHEAVLSRHGYCSERSTEVEHPHNDWLYGVVQYGLFGGLLWLAFLLLTLRASLRAIHRTDGTFALAGAAAGAVLVNALFHGPLLVSPASAVLAFALFGLLLEEDGLDAPGFNRMVIGRVTGALGLFAVWFAIPLVQHGQAMTDYARAVDRLLHASDGNEPELVQAGQDAHAAALAAHAAAPRSVPAGILRCQIGDAKAILPLIDSLLQYRPHSFELLELRSFRLLKAERFDEARADLEAALFLDPSHPRILKQLIRLEMTVNEIARGQGHLDTLTGHGCLDPDWMESLGTELLLTARLEAGLLILARLDERLVEADDDGVWRLSEEAKVQKRRRLSDALRVHAKVGYARGQVGQGNLSQAIVNYRQARQASARSGPAGGAPALRMELAAAEWRAGRQDDALANLEGLDPFAFDRHLLPDWAAEALTEAGFLR